MRPPVAFVVMTSLVFAPAANAQTAAAAPAPAAATQPAVTTRAATAQPAAVRVHEGVTGHAARRSHARQPSSRRAAAAAHATAPAGTSGSVLDLGATDITGNKELPKVMVIVPWKDSLGASGVVKPTDSLLDEVLQPVDRSVFQRRIRYYGQLDGAKPGMPPQTVAPVGDSH